MSAGNTYTVLKLSATAKVHTAPDLGVPLNGTAPFTIDAWFRFSGLSATAAILLKEGVFRFGIVGQQLAFEIAGYPPLPADPPAHAVDDDAWHHVACTWNGTAQARLYVDGVQLLFASISGTGSSNAKPVLICHDIQGFVRSVRLFNAALEADQVKKAMFNDAAAGTIAAWFDFSQNPPLDRGPRRLPLVIEGDATVVTKRPAASFTGTAYAQPLRDERVNPGGQRLDPYTVQASVWAQGDPRSVQAIYVNNELERDSGMALLLEFESAPVNRYRIRSLRGSRTNGDSLVTDPVIAPRTWYSIATTFDGRTLAIYVDGRLIASKPCGPIALAHNHGHSLIGEALAQGLLPAGETSLAGYIGRVDIWEIALPAEAILKAMTVEPLATSDGLVAVYDFTSSPARNHVNGNPIGLADGAALDAQVSRTKGGEGAVDDDGIAPVAAGDELTPAELEEVRASLDFRELIDTQPSLFDAGMAADTEMLRANGASEDAVGKLHASWSDAIRRLRDDPASLPFLVTRHRLRGEDVLVFHADGRSWIGLRASESGVDECTLWMIELMLILIGGILSVIFGVAPTAASRATQLLTRAARLPAISRLLAAGEAMSGPIVLQFGRALYDAGILRELLYMLLDVGIFTLVRIVARAFAVLLGAVGAVADIIAALAAAAATFALAYLRRPSSCEPLPIVDISAIKFNHDPSNASVDALTIRRNATTDIVPPEWVKGKTLAAESPAAYAVSLVGGNVITIRARFVVTTAQPVQVQIRADGGGILGAIPEFTVSFVSGSSAWTTINLPNHQLANAGVSRQTATWTWAYKIGGSSWRVIGRTSHLIYTLLALPRGPWRASPLFTETQIPWTDVLDYACDWAAQSTTAGEALRRITAKVNGGLGLVYDQNGVTQYTAASSSRGGDIFQCTDFLKFLRGAGGNGNAVNCSDCAAIITTFANALGCNVFGAVMGTNRFSRRDFKVNHILAIGRTAWNYPFPSQEFSYHEVAWSGAGSHTDPLWDACLQVEDGNDPWSTTGVHIGLLPVSMNFTTRGINPLLPIATPFTDRSYRERLCQNIADGIGKCTTDGPWPDCFGGRRPVE
jgi:hypothetical protein